MMGTPASTPTPTPHHPTTPLMLHASLGTSYYTRRQLRPAVSPAETELLLVLRLAQKTLPLVSASFPCQCCQPFKVLLSPDAKLTGLA